MTDPTRTSRPDMTILEAAIPDPTPLTAESEAREALLGDILALPMAEEYDWLWPDRIAAIVAAAATAERERIAAALPEALAEAIHHLTAVAAATERHPHVLSYDCGWMADNLLVEPAIAALLAPPKGEAMTDPTRTPLTVEGRIAAGWRSSTTRTSGAATAPGPLSAEARIRLVSYLHLLTPTKTLNHEQTVMVDRLVTEAEAAAATAERERLTVPDNVHEHRRSDDGRWSCQACATAERERWEPLLREAIEVVHQTGSIRDHADPDDNTGWHVKGIETCADSLCVDALALLGDKP